MNETSTLLLTDGAIAAQADRLSQAASEHAVSGRRYVLGIAGVPGSGKSTLGERLTRTINDGSAANTAVFIPMDGFHLPNATLDARGDRSRKGAAFTYDAEGYVALLEGFRDTGRTGGFPVYCRVAHDPVPSTQQVTETTRLIITEGQYLLVNEPPWCRLGEVFDETWWIEQPLDRARDWLRRRDLSVGRDPDEAAAKYERNDRLNTEWMLRRRGPADLHVYWPEEA